MKNNNKKRIPIWIKSGFIGAGIFLFLFVITNVFFFLNIPYLYYINIFLTIILFPVIIFLLKIVFHCYKEEMCYLALFHPLSIIIEAVYLILIGFIFGSIIGLLIKILKKLKK